MSTPQQPKPVRLFVSLISKTQQRIARVLTGLTDTHGSLDFVSAVLPFDYTDYYYVEMGQPLIRRFATFDRFIEQEDLAPIKEKMNLIEMQLSVAGKRTVNIDPGYLSADRLVLASGKNNVHRIYLSRGIYADLTLVYYDKDYRPLPWTYPDYAEVNVRAWLRALRQKYLHQLRS
jgi:hypothetical protein